MTDADENPSPQPRARRSPAFLATAVALPVAVLACFIAFVVLAQQRQDDARAAAEAGHLRTITAPSSGDPACGTLLGALPADLGSFRRDGTADPAGFSRWTSESSGAVELRCGIERPAGLSPTAKLQVVNGVQWLEGTPSGAAAPDGGSYWSAVDHRPYVVLWVPDGAGATALQVTSDAIKAHLQPGSLDLGR